MAWSAERIDKGNTILRAVRMVGFANMGAVELELILNLARLVGEKGQDTTLRDISRTEECVRELFQEEATEEVAQ